MNDSKKTQIDPRILRTRQSIREAFVDLLDEMDAEKISVNKIAERATINRVTFYLHYRDIPDMMDKLAEEMIENVAESLDVPDEPSDPSDGEADWPMLVRLLEHLSANADWYKAVLASGKTPVFTERLLKLLTERVAATIEGEGGVYLSAAGIRKDVAVWYDSSALIGAIVCWLRKDMPYEPRAFAEQLSLLREHPNR